MEIKLWTVIIICKQCSDQAPEWLTGSPVRSTNTAVTEVSISTSNAEIRELCSTQDAVCNKNLSIFA